MKSFAAGLLVGAIVLVLGAFCYLRLGLVDVRADTPGPRWAASLLYAGIHASVRRTAAKMQNPFPLSNDVLAAGRKLYLNDCVGCHGEPGKSASDFGATFYPPAPQFPLVGTGYSETEVFWIAKHGIRRTGMAAQASSYTDQEIWALAAFIKRMSNLPAPPVSALQNNADWMAMK